jgi:membrane-bound lytic murein transglycosylase D
MTFSRFSIAIFATLLAGNVVAFAQGQTAASGLRNAPDEAAKAEARLTEVTDKAGRFFKQGLLNLQDNKRVQARGDFDLAVEAFLRSGLDLNRNASLKNCFWELNETIYRIEFPSAQTPQVRKLAATCKWTLESEYVAIADTLQKPITNNPTVPVTNDPVVASVSSSTLPSTIQQQSGFVEQNYEPSPLDELAKLELNQEEQNIETPEAQASQEYIRVAVSRGSLGFGFQFNGQIQQFINYYQGRGRSTMETGLYRSGYFMRMARRIFREEGLPENIAWLGQVESAWKPTAQSWAAAAGLWQFIPGTGARYGLRMTSHLDERRSFEKATRASARYLKFLANRYNGNLELAMGAYNCGEGNVDRAIARAGAANFWLAYPYLPRETRNYVPNILATILIANDPARYGFGHVRPAPPLMYDQVRVPSSTSLSLLAQASDSSVEYLRYLNPELRQNVTPPEPYIIRIPAGKANPVVAVLRRIPASSRTTTAVTNVAAGESWQTISNRTGVSVEQLQAMNTGVKPQGGSKVVVPNNVKKVVYNRPTNAPPTPVSAAPRPTVRVVKAQAGDTVEKLAARYGASALDVAKYNGLYVSTVLPAGREIKLPPR